MGQEEGGGACELPPRAGPAAAKHFLKLQQQQLSFLQTSRLGHRQQQHLARGRAWPRVVISTIMVTMISTIGGHATKSASRPRASSCNGPLTTSPSPSLTLSPSWSDETEERRLVEEEGS